MAVSDPTSSVPTPTGTLQGVAQFSWDGANWQPAGRSMASVATPTGVLRGVAPFTYDGTSWQPSGRARPGVPTPTGTLDGVAVYTWSGSAWTPAGGAPDVPTPSGTLQGVAAFYWDGTAWQPSGKAAAEVATPSGVLAGMAMFNWSGSAWVAAAAGPPGVTLDLNFITMTTLDPRVTFTRASTATYFDNTGTMQTAAANTARLDHDPVSHASLGLLVEEQRVNVLYPSVLNAVGWAPTGTVGLGGSVTAPDGTTTTTSMIYATDTSNSIRAYDPNITPAGTASAAYVVSAYMKAAPVANGYIQVNTGGAAAMAYFDLTNGIAVVGADLAAGVTAKSVAITPAGNGWYRVVFAFTTPAGATSVYPYFGPCSVVSGTGDNRSYTGVVGQGIYVWGTQIEAGPAATSYIPTVSATVTRAADVATLASIPGRNATAESFDVEVLTFNAAANNPRIVGQTPGQFAMIFLNNQHGASYDPTPAVVQTANSFTIGAVTKTASTWASPNTGRVCMNAGAVALATTQTSGFSTIVAVQLGGDSATTDQLNGYVRRFRYWPRVLTDAEIQQVTT